MTASTLFLGANGRGSEGHPGGHRPPAELAAVDEMIENRFQDGDEVERLSQEDGLWPQELWVEAGKYIKIAI